MLWFGLFMVQLLVPPIETDEWPLIGYSFGSLLIRSLMIILTALDSLSQV